MWGYVWNYINYKIDSKNQILKNYFFVGCGDLPKVSKPDPISKTLYNLYMSRYFDTCVNLKLSRT